MIVYSTLCSKNKRKAPLPLKAIDRYISGRIKRIYTKSVLDRVNFRIFSGKYGLLKPENKIFWYDKKLTRENIASMVHLLQKQISREKIKKIVFFAYNPKRNRAWNPYCKAITEACRKKKVELIIRFL